MKKEVWERRRRQDAVGDRVKDEVRRRLKREGDGEREQRRGKDGETENGSKRGRL